MNLATEPKPNLDQKPYIDNVPLPQALPTAVSPYNYQALSDLTDMPLWKELQEFQKFIDAQNSSSPSFTPPSLSSSLSSSPESYHLPFRSIGAYTQSLAGLEPQERSGTLSPLPWIKPGPIANNQAEALPIDGLGFV
jgi:hypothetical protein